MVVHRGQARERGVTVVSPSRNNPEEIRRFLKAMKVSCALLDEPSEVVVVDDSAAAAAAQIRGACRAYEAVCLPGPRNVGAKRNAGAARAQYDVLVFVDSDCIPSEHLLIEHLRSHRNSDDGRLGGVAGPVQIVEGNDLAARVAARASHANPPFAWGATHSRLGWAPTANLSVRANAFEEIGGFDEDSYTVNGGEDVDLGIRLNTSGRTIIGNGRAVAVHGAAAQSLMSLIRKVNRYGRADVFLRTKHYRRTESYLNRATAGVTIAMFGAMTGTLLRAGRLTTAACLGGMVLAASQPLKPGPIVGATDPLVDVLARTVDFSFDFGTFTEAIRRGRPDLLLGRFSYYRPDEFEQCPP